MISVRPVLISANGLIGPCRGTLTTAQTTTRRTMTDSDASKQPSAILSRVSWKLPVASKAEGIYIDLQDGRRLIDAVGMIIASSAVSTVIQIPEL